MSTVSQFLGEAGSSGAPGGVFVFTKSGQFIARKDGTVRLTAVGAGASGAACFSNPCRATGGSAGGYIPGVPFKVKKGDVWTITLGAFGQGVTASVFNTDAIPGNDGGDTTIVGPGVNVTVQGGKGGTAQSATGTAIGPDGGQVIGCPGFQGGGAGSSSSNGASGGGAVNFFGVDPEDLRSGDITFPGASGGASAGGASLPTVSGRIFTGGAGANGTGTGLNGGDGNTVPAFVTVSSLPLEFPTGAGTNGASSAASGDALNGGGSGASNTRSGSADLGAGTGGVYGTGGRSGDTKLGGGSGGVAAQTSGAALNSGNGGEAIVIIEEL